MKRALLLLAALAGCNAPHPDVTGIWTGRDSLTQLEHRLDVALPSVVHTTPAGETVMRCHWLNHEAEWLTCSSTRALRYSRGSLFMPVDDALHLVELRRAR